MNLQETILKMKETAKSQENFDILIETMCRKADKGLLEGITSDDVRNTVKEIETPKKVNTIDESFTMEIAEITDAENYYNTYIENQPTNANLSEAVTFVDNAGQVKTMSAVDYVKDMHEYHTETQIKPYEKKNKKFIIDYKLLDEMIDEVELEDAILLNEKSSDQVFNAKHDPDEYVARKNIKQSLRTGEYTEKSKDISRRTLEKADGDDELSSIKAEIHAEMSKTPVDRKKVKELYRKYKKAYKSKKGVLKKSVKDDRKLEKIENKKVKNLYEMSIEEALHE